MANPGKTNIYIDGTQAGTTLNQLTAAYRQLNKDIKNLSPTSDEYRKKVQELQQVSGALQHHRDDIRGVSSSYSEATTSLKSMLSQFGPLSLALGGIGLAIGGVKAGIQSWYDNNLKMEKSMSSLKSLTGASTADMKFFAAEAKKMGDDVNSSFSSIEALEGFQIIGSANDELLNNKEALAAVTKEAMILADAANIDLGPAAQAVVGTLNQFNLSGDHSTRVVNAFAAGAQAGAAEIDDLTASTEKFGTVAAANNVTVEESVALTELLAQKNIKGSEAGNQIRNVLLNVATASALPDKALKAMEKYGVNLEIVTNKALPLNERLTEMAKVQGDQNALLAIFGKENVVAGQTILTNIDRFDELTDAVTGTNSAYEQAAINNDNLDGDLKNMSNAWINLTTGTTEGGKLMREAVQALTGVIKFLADNMSTIVSVVGKVIKAFLLYRTTLIAIKAYTFATSGGLKDLATNFFKVETSANKANSASSKMASALKGAGWMIIVALIAAVVSEITDLITGTSAMEAKIESMNRALANESKAVQASISKSREKIEAKKKELELLVAQDKITKEMAESQLADLIANESRKKSVERQFANESKDAAKKELAELQKAQDQWDNNQYSQMTKQMQKMFAADVSKAGRQIDILKERIATENVILKENAVFIKDLGNESHSIKIAQTEAEKALTAEQLEAQKKANADRLAMMKKLQDELAKLIKSTQDFSNDFEYDKKLKAFSDEQLKEVFVMEKTLNDKYAKEIETATRLAKVKGDIGIKATEQLNTLIALKDNELTERRKEIDNRYRQEKQDAEYESWMEHNLAYIQAQQDFESQLLEIKISKAKMAANAVLEGDISGKRQAAAQLEALLLEQLDNEKTLKLEALLDQFDEELITREQFNLAKDELDEERRMAEVEMKQAHTDEMYAIELKAVEDMVSNFEQAFQIFKDLSRIQHNNEMTLIKKERNAEEDALAQQLASKTISEEEYRIKKEQIDLKYGEKERAAKTAQAKKEKDMAIFQATINTALAVIKAAPNPITMALAAAAGLVNIGLIASEPIPQFKDGGYTDVVGQQDGLRYRAQNKGRLKAGMTPSNPTLALVSERGPEYFVPNHLLRSQRVINHVQAIEAIRTNSVPQFAEGGYTSSGAIPGAGGFGSDPLLTQAIQQNTAVLGQLLMMMPDLKVVIGDEQLEDIETRTAFLSKIKS